MQFEMFLTSMPSWTQCPNWAWTRPKRFRFFVVLLCQACKFCRSAVQSCDL